jgi:2-keto-3-deoxy-L-rhamnonate aldolase RhmA
VKAAIARVSQACKGAGERTGIFALGAAGLRTRPAEGFTLLAAGVDSRLLGGAVDSLLQDLKRDVV